MGVEMGLEVSLKGREYGESEELVKLLENTNLIAGVADTWRWTLDPGGVFSVKELSMKIEKVILMSSTSKKATHLNSWISQEINISFTNKIQPGASRNKVWKYILSFV